MFLVQICNSLTIHYIYLYVRIPKILYMLFIYNQQIEIVTMLTQSDLTNKEIKLKTGKQNETVQNQFKLPGSLALEAKTGFYSFPILINLTSHRISKVVNLLWVS